ncbi:MAG: DUF2807 domain-containing protein [Steroidobacteraceae bacterium]
MTCRTSITPWPEYLAAALLAALALTGCGNRAVGPVVSQQRGVDAFHSIELRGSASVEVVAGAPASLMLSASQSVLGDVTTVVHNGVLVIDHETRWYAFGSHDNLQLRIATPQLNAFTVSGAGDVKIDAGTGEALAIVLSGAGQIRASGARQSLNARINGAGNMDLSQLRVVDATLYVNGAGNLQTLVTGSLKAEVNGVGSIRYAGNPAQVEPSIHGVGSIGPATSP